MHVKTLKLHDFRNYVNSQFSFDPYLNIIVGPNGAGKTNLLESIIMVSNARSFRTRDDRDLIRKGEDYARIDLLAEEDSFRIVLGKNGRSLFIDGTPIKKTSQFIGKLNAILFKPGDLELFSQSPAIRRRLMDMEISKVSRRYIDALLLYNHLLKDKNRLLKEEDIDMTLLKVIDESLVPLIIVIMEERERFFASIDSLLASTYQKISGKATDIKVEYKRCAEYGEVADRLMDSQARDLVYRYSTFGTHHEDYRFLMDGNELGSFASQGQKRMTMIAFKFALIDYIKINTGKDPIVLLDDILSELDRDNQERLMAVIPQNTQVIITNTDIKGLNIDKEYKLIEIKEAENG